MAILTYTIGRAQGCEIPVEHATVSRRHAELVVGQNGILYLTDCASTFGTFRVHGGDWETIRQCEVRRSDRVCLGEHVTTIGELLAAVERETPPDASQSGSDTPAETPVALDDRPSGNVRRHPETGEILVD
ncbi:MAG: FHA domain-containing protein [Pseudomonadota bacterium]